MDSPAFDTVFQRNWGIPSIMGVRATWAVVSVGLVGIIIFGLAFYMGWFPGGWASSCSSLDIKMIPMLESQRMLAVHPDNALEEGRRRSGCNEDEAHVYAYASYSYSGHRAGIMSFYRAAAQQDGWRPLDPDSFAASSTMDGLCFGRLLKGASAYLSILADRGDGGNGSGAYTVTVWAIQGDPPSDDEVMC